jgi:nucleotide-binding universal stress UspA family protein
MLLATDGTLQSEPAIDVARLFDSAAGAPVSVLTVVDHPPIPWGGVDLKIVREYERSLQTEALENARDQVKRAGAVSWEVEVRTGDPAEVIAARALELKAGLILVGLGGHGPTARLFGSETALRLARSSKVPVLAVAPQLKARPCRIVVAMDFSESSIEAARLALQLASPTAVMTLIHVVPWERKEYIPEEWFRVHETKVGSELRRVAGWLGVPHGVHIVHRIMHGKAAPSLLAAADELNADLIVAGTHNRGLTGRILAGQTIARLIRGARCSVLVQPRSAA